MKLLATVSELNAANAETAKALESLALMETRATTAEENLKTASASVIALTSERDAALASLKEQSAAIVTAQEKINALETAAKGFELKVATLAASTVASLGHEPVKISTAATAVSVQEQYRSMKPGPERVAFRAKHLAQLAVVNSN